MEFKDAAPRLKRAESWAGLTTKWQKRTQLAAEWLQDSQVVADIGCGLMSLETFLPVHATYLPMDVVRRDARTVVFDLNRENIPPVTCDVAVLLGVVEYVDDLAAVFRQLHQFPKTLLSYNHVSINDVLWKAGLRKKNVDWRNRHTKRSVRQLLAGARLAIVRERAIRIGETLYDIRPR
jgi:hypothetical protein